MATWLEDRLALKRMAREEVHRFTPIVRTLVYACIAQMRGKLHMKSYRQRNGGWKSLPDGRRWSEIRHLADQREWIWHALTRNTSINVRGNELADIAGRVFNQAWEPRKEWETDPQPAKAQEQPRFPVDGVVFSGPLGNAEVKW